MPLLQGQSGRLTEAGPGLVDRYELAEPFRQHVLLAEGGCSEKDARPSGHGPILALGDGRGES
jgi:hypothetical protein